MKTLLLAATAVLLPVAVQAQTTGTQTDPVTGSTTGTGATTGTMSDPATSTTPATDAMTSPAMGTVAPADPAATGSTYGTTGTTGTTGGVTYGTGATATPMSDSTTTTTGSTYGTGGSTYGAGGASTGADASGGSVSAPDGSRAFGIEPYVGVFGGYHDFDKGSKGALQLGNSANGWLAGGYAGVNIPLGPLVVGAEGNIAKGFSDIDFEYGVTGHVGIRVGESGMFFGRAGYHWVEAKRGFADDRNEIYGFGVEVGPKDIGLGGITGESGVRIRFAIDTFDVFQSIRPQVGLTFHF